MFEGAPLAYWIGFLILVLVATVCDLAILNRGTGGARAAAQTKAEIRTHIRAQTGANLIFVLLLFALAAVFGVWLAHTYGRQTGLEFASGYLIELSLSIDNLFVFLVMFRAFGLEQEEQKKALLLGILGAIVMRGLFILAGIGLLRSFSWMQYAFGALLLAAAVRLARGKMEQRGIDRPAGSRKAQAQSGAWVQRLARRWAGNSGGVLLSAVVAIELVDLVFALDSIPAVLAVTRTPFVAYTSNILAILGLRSLYFLLAGLLNRLRFLHFGLAAILAFVGAKMILAEWLPISTVVSLIVIFLLAAITTVASLLSPEREAEYQREQK